MSITDDVRKVVQDMVAPDLRAPGVRMESLEKSTKLAFETAEHMNKLRFEAIEERFKHAEQTAALRQELLVARVDKSLDKMDQAVLPVNVRMDKRNDRMEVITDRLDQTQAAIKSSHETIMAALGMDRRLEGPVSFPPPTPRQPEEPKRLIESAEAA